MSNVSEMKDIQLDGYTFRQPVAEKYARLLFRVGRIAQGAEMNELQYMFGRDLRGIADAVFRDGDLIKGGRVTIKTVAALPSFRCTRWTMKVTSTPRSRPPTWTP